MAVLRKPLDVQELQRIVRRERLALPAPPPSSSTMSEQGKEAPAACSQTDAREHHPRALSVLLSGARQV